LIGLLSTEVEEVPMSGPLGVQIYQYVFESSGPILEARVAQEIRAIIRDKEPRVTVLAVTTETKTSSFGTVTEAVVDYVINGEQARLTVPIGGS